MNRLIRLDFDLIETEGERLNLNSPKAKFTEFSKLAGELLCIDTATRPPPSHNRTHIARRVDQRFYIDGPIATPAV